MCETHNPSLVSIKLTVILSIYGISGVCLANTAMRKWLGQVVFHYSEL